MIEAEQLESPRNLFEHTHDLSGSERVMSAVAGAALTWFGIRRRSLTGAFIAAGGSALLAQAATGYRPVMASIGRVRSDTRTALGGRRGLLVDEAVTINRPADVLYNAWRSLDTLPRIMPELVSVAATDDGKSHWVAKVAGNRTVEWDAEIINEIPNQLIAWRSVDGSQVASAGSVKFTPAAGGRETHVEVRLQYEPPAGKAGAAVAWLAGHAPSQVIREGVRRFKAWMEAGEVPTTAGQPHGQTSILNYD